MLVLWFVTRGGGGVKKCPKMRYVIYGWPHSIVRLRFLIEAKK